MSEFTLRTYEDGRMTGAGSFDCLYDALQAAATALCGVSGPGAEEYEVLTYNTVAGLPGKREVLVAYGYDETLAKKRNTEEYGETA